MNKMNIKSSDSEYLRKFTELFSYNHDNDREIVILGCAFLEQIVSDILMSFLVEDPKETLMILDNSNGALASFVQKSRMLYLLGLLNKTVLHDIKTVAKMRNKFAHNVFISFSDKEVSKLCKDLKWHIETMGHPPSAATDRDLYQVGVNQLICYLNGILCLAITEKRMVMK